MPKIVGIIPARYHSTRFPGKPLAEIFGKPMIQHVYEKSKMSKYLEDIIVATDDERIYDAVLKFGGKAVMTPSQIKTGTDRVAYVAEEIEADIIANIQCDEPMIRADMIDSAIEPLLSEPDADISTLAVRIKTADDIFNPNVVKVVFDKNNYALYFSRCSIPFVRDHTASEKWLALNCHYKHIGIYVFRKASLLKFVNLPESELEKVEKLEQLRALENGMKIKIALTKFETISVDTPEDLERVKKALSF